MEPRAPQAADGAEDDSLWDLPNPLLTPDRRVPSVSPPEWRRLSLSRLLTNPNDFASIRLDLLRQHLLAEGRLSLDAVLALLAATKPVLAREPNVLNLAAPLSVVGDIHGQYYDLINILTDDRGTIPLDNRRYLFLGDYVDRGHFSTEVCIYLFAFKLVCPDRVWLLRGNHECRLLTSHFNFRKECLIKYNLDVYNAFMDVFDQLPLAATVETKGMGKYFCIHGGLSPSLRYIDDVNKINRFTEPPSEGSFCDVLWSDPIPEETSQDLEASEMEEWRNLRFFANPLRGCGYIFGLTAAQNFCHDNNISFIIRGHEVQAAGYRLHRFHIPEQERKYPLAVTVFSAPNYCDMYSNVGAVMELSNTSYHFKAYDSVPHPYCLPNFDNVFNFSIPFMMKGIVQWLTKAILDVRRESRRRNSAYEDSRSISDLASSASTSPVRMEMDSPRTDSGSDSDVSASPPVVIKKVIIRKRIIRRIRSPSPARSEESPVEEAPAEKPKSVLEALSIPAVIEKPEPQMHMAETMTDEEPKSPVEIPGPGEDEPMSPSSCEESRPAVLRPKPRFARPAQKMNVKVPPIDILLTDTIKETVSEGEVSPTEPKHRQLRAVDHNRFKRRPLSASSNGKKDDVEGVDIEDPISRIRPGTVTSRINEFGLIEKTNSGSHRSRGSEYEEMQNLLRGIFTKSRDSLLQHATKNAPRSPFETARSIDMENERRPVGQLKEFFDKLDTTRRTYRDRESDTDKAHFCGRPYRHPSHFLPRYDGSAAPDAVYGRSRRHRHGHTVRAESDAEIGALGNAQPHDDDDLL